MPNIALGYRNDLKGLAVTPTDEDSSFVAENATDHKLFPEYRSASGTTTTNLDVDTGAAPAITPEFQLFAAIRMDGFKTAGTLQWIVDNDVAFGSPTIDSTALSIDTTYSRPLVWEPYGGLNYAYIHGSSSAHRYHRLTMVNTGGADARLGVMWAGPRWQPVKSYTARRHEPIRLAGTTRRRVVLTYPFLTPAEAKEIFDIEAALGSTGRVVVIPQDDKAESFLTEVMLATMDPIVELAEDLTDQHRGLVLSFTEVAF